jgi:hypothetical protein
MGQGGKSWGRSGQAQPARASKPGGANYAARVADRPAIGRGSQRFKDAPFGAREVSGIRKAGRHPAYPHNNHSSLFVYPGRRYAPLAESAVGPVLLS